MGTGEPTGELKDVWNHLRAAASQDEVQGDLEDYEEPDFEYWQHGGLFGIRQPLDVICGPEPAASAAMPVLCDASQPGVAAEASGGCGKEIGEEQPPAKRQRGSDTSAAGNEADPLQPLSNRRSKLDPDVKTWIEAVHAEYMAESGREPTAVAEAKWFQTTRDKHVATGKISTFVTAEGLRSHIRGVAKKLQADKEEKERAEAAAAAEKKEQKEKKDKAGKAGKKEQKEKKEKTETLNKNEQKDKKEKAGKADKKDQKEKKEKKEKGDKGDKDDPIVYQPANQADINNFFDSAASSSSRGRDIA